MKRKSKVDKENNNDHSNLIRLLEEYTPLERQKFLNRIDKILCSFLNIKEKDLPWMNPQNNRKKWLKLTRRIRLVVGRIEFETNEQKERTIH